MSTLATAFGRPQSGEYNPYYDRYISLISSDDIINVLEKQAVDTVGLLKSAGAKADFRYAPGKWSVKEVLGHVNDTERIMAYRALRVSRGDKTPMAGFEQDDYVRDGNFGQRTLPDLVAEFADIRKATVSFVRHLDAEAGARRGTANNDVISARALPYIIAGHELHHRRILQERYLK
jgi:hypothetical protein